MPAINPGNLRGSPEDKARFWQIVNEGIPEADLTEDDHRILISRAGFLRKSERQAYKNVFVRENLTEEEKYNYRKALLIEAYFPKQEEVEAYYGNC